MPKSDSPKSHLKKPVSEKQLAANRANAAKSTGPTSNSGKARSSQNAVNHGFSSPNFTVVRLEGIDEVARLRADAIAVYQPINSQELFAVEQIAIRQQAMLRAARFEAGLFSTCLNESLGPDGSATFPLNEDVTYGIEITQAQNRNYCLADGFFRLARQSNGIQLFLRYQAQAERLYRRAVEEFERLKKLRPELPNQPISDAEPGGAGDLVAGQPADGTALDGPALSASQPDSTAPNQPISSPPVRPVGTDGFGGAGAFASQLPHGSAGDLVVGQAQTNLHRTNDGVDVTSLPGAGRPYYFPGRCIRSARL